MTAQPLSQPGSLTRRLYGSRWLIYELVYRDLRLRYRGSVLGFAWTLLNPLLFMAVYALVFGVYLRMQVPAFPVFLVAGLLPWQWFTTSTQMGTSCILDGAMYVGKTVFDPAILVAVPVLSGLANFLLSLPLIVIIAALNHVAVSWIILLLPLLLVIQIVLMMGVLLILSTLNVFFRDLQQLITVLLLLLFYLTPIFYPYTAVPAQFKKLVLLNPMAPLVLAYQDIFYFGRLPSINHVLYASVCALTFFVVGRVVFRRYRDAFPEYV